MVQHDSARPIDIATALGRGGSPSRTGRNSYARHGCYRVPRVRAKHQANLTLVLDHLPGWTAAMLAELTQAMARVQRSVESSSRHPDEVEGLLDQAIAVAAQVHSQYAAATDKIRRRINRGFFRKLWINEEGHVANYELTEPFAALIESGGPIRSAATAKVGG